MTEAQRNIDYSPTSMIKAIKLNTYSPYSLVLTVTMNYERLVALISNLIIIINIYTRNTAFSTIYIMHFSSLLILFDGLAVKIHNIFK